MSRFAGGFDGREPQAAANLRLKTTLVDALRQISSLALRIAESEAARPPS
jgi:hypothetical protein